MCIRDRGARVSSQRENSPEPGCTLPAGPSPGSTWQARNPRCLRRCPETGRSRKANRPPRTCEPLAGHVAARAPRWLPGWQGVGEAQPRRPPGPPPRTP
eukprot:9779157-Alexandrium_andersonii.AAC.1